MSRRFDIFVNLLPEAEQRDTFKFLSFGFTETLGVKGFQMLINSWLKCLLTTKGSDPSNINYGTSFMHLLGSNVDIASARDVVILNIEQCNEQIIAFQDKDTTLTTTERLASANLINFEERPDDPGFHAYIEIQNQAGERLQFLLPVHGDT